MLNGMNLKLRVFRRDYFNSLSVWNNLRFAVVDMNKSESYPQNFVSILPMRIDSDGKGSVFTKYFGNKSLETARGLLTEALKTEDDFEIKTEITRRLNLLDPEPVVYSKCRMCKKFFQTKKKRGFKPRICPKCQKKRESKK
jgi:hypothetical protein